MGEPETRWRLGLIAARVAARRVARPVDDGGKEPGELFHGNGVALRGVASEADGPRATSGQNIPIPSRLEQIRAAIASAPELAFLSQEEDYEEVGDDCDREPEADTAEDDEPEAPVADAVELPVRAPPRAEPGRRLRKRRWRPRENRRVQLRRLGLTPGTYTPGRVVGHLSRKERRTLIAWPRPRVWGDCMPGSPKRWWGDAPCPYVSCRGNLGLDVSAAGSIRVVLGLGDGRGSCALELAQDGTRTLEEVAELEGCTREAVRLIEASALLKIRRRVDC